MFAAWVSRTVRLLLILSAGCGGNLQAVVDTAKAGEQLDRFRPQLHLMDRSCQEMVDARQAHICPSRVGRADAALEAIVAYAWELERSAEPGSVNSGSHVYAALSATKVWNGVSDGDAQKVGQLTAIVSNAIAREASRHAVRDAIRAASPWVDGLVGALVAHLAVSRLYVAHERCVVRCQEGYDGDAACPGMTVCPDPEDARVVLPLARLRLELEDEDRSMTEAQAAFRAFRAAHDALVHGVDDLSAADLANAVERDLQGTLP